MKLFPIALVFLIVFSCAESEENRNSNSSSIQVTLEKTDSLVVKDVLATVFLFQGKIENQFIFRDLVSSEVYIFDEEGALINRWNKEGDVPGKFSMSSGNFHFDREGHAVVLDIMNGLKVLELNGDVVHDFGIYQYQVSLAGGFSLFDTQQIIEKDGQEYLLYSLDIIEEYDGEYAPEFLKERKHILLTNVETNETEKFLHFPESSRFLNGEVFYFRDIRPVFHYDQKEELLYLMFQGENVMYKYDWSGEQPKLIDSQELNLKGFENAEGFPPGSIQLGQYSNFEKRPFPSTIINLSRLNSDLLISYAGTPEDKAAIAKVVKEKAFNETMDKLTKETPRGTLLLRPDGQLIPVDLPPMHYGSFKVVGEDIYWMKKPDPDIEAEEFTLYWGKLKIE